MKDLARMFLAAALAAFTFWYLMTQVDQADSFVPVIVTFFLFLAMLGLVLYWPNCSPGPYLGFIGIVLTVAMLGTRFTNLHLIVGLPLGLILSFAWFVISKVLRALGYL